MVRLAILVGTKAQDIQFSLVRWNTVSTTQKPKPNRKNHSIRKPNRTEKVTKMKRIVFFGRFIASVKVTPHP